MQINAIKLPLVELKNINVKYGQHVALSNINLTVYPNSIITIVGPNGGGKSTLLKVLLKLQQPTSGQVIYNKHIRISPPESFCILLCIKWVIDKRVIAS